jgi:uncharacterized protein (TIGR01244 family)
MPPRIVALSKRLSVASQITSDDVSAIAAGGFRTIINNRPDGEEADQLTSTLAKRDADSVGVGYHYLPVTTASLTVEDIDSFEKLLASVEGPVLAHCRSGTRCYLLWAATELRAGVASAESLIREAADRGFDISALARFSSSTSREGS